MAISQDAALLLTLSNLQTQLFKKVSGPLTAHGISFTEFIVLLHLNDSPARNMRRIDLAEKIGLTASGVTRLLNPMQKIGLVEKEESVRDARVSLIAITEAGTQLFNDAERTFNESAGHLLAPLNAKHHRAFSEIAGALLS
ncbi:MAG: MarR family transcriptional regulator [Verrucomicrobiales bacterium]|nr:MarR family transcriptional regulator [Verrucomicrobiales bacterium]